MVQYILSTFDENGKIFVIHVFCLSYIWLFMKTKEKTYFHENNNERNMSEVDYWFLLIYWLYKKRNFTSPA